MTLRPVVVAAMSAAMLCAAVVAGGIAVSDLAAARPRQLMDRWQDGQSIGSHALRQRMLDRLASAIALTPGNADLWLELGRFYAWHASFHPSGGERHALFTRRALSAFEAAAARRPSWGYAWARAAEQRVALALDGATTIEWVLRADALAPREAVTQLKVIWVGFGFWPRLSTEQQLTIAASLQRLLDDPAHALAAARIAHHHSRMDLVKGHDKRLRADPQYRKWMANQ